MKRLQKLGILFLVLVMGLCSAASASGVVELNDEERCAMNLFLSNFTEVGSDVRNAGPDRDLVDFAHDYLWCNDNESFEYGKYANDTNCRVSDDRIQEIIDEYFYEPYEVDLAQTRFDYDGEYYYHEETGGWANMGFALTLDAYEAEPGIYYVAFLTFGQGVAWEDGDLNLSLAEAEAKFGVPQYGGHAWIAASDIADRATYRMIDFAY